MNIGQRIRTLREVRGWTQGQLLVQARRYAPVEQPLARATLSKIENGHNIPNAWTLAAIAQALDTTTDYLMGMSNDADLPDEFNDARITYVVRSGVDPGVAQQLITDFSRLSPADRQLVLDLIHRLTGYIRPRIVGAPPEE